MLYPLVIGGVCILTSVIGTFFVKLGASQSIMGALYKGFLASSRAFGHRAVAGDRLDHRHEHELFGGGRHVRGPSPLLLGSGGLAHHRPGIIWITEYYTGTNYRPVRSVAKSSETGHGTNVIQGLAVSMEATAVPAIIIAAGIIATYSLAGLLGIAISL